MGADLWPGVHLKQISFNICLNMIEGTSVYGCSKRRLRAAREAFRHKEAAVFTQGPVHTHSAPVGIQSQTSYSGGVLVRLLIIKQLFFDRSSWDGFQAFVKAITAMIEHFLNMATANKGPLASLPVLAAALPFYSNPNMVTHISVGTH